MLFNTALFSSLLLVPAVLAVTSVIESDWAGAYFTEGSGTFDNITATLTVPTTSGSINASTLAAIGIDGFTCGTGSLLFAGVNFTVDYNGQTEYIAFYSSGASVMANFRGITISAGDDITLTVAAFSDTSGAVTVENLTNQESATETLTFEPLCRQDVGWIVMDLSGPLVNFGTVTYINAKAEGYGTYYTPYESSASLADMVVNGQTLVTSSTCACSESLTIQYTGT